MLACSLLLQAKQRIRGWLPSEAEDSSLASRRSVTDRCKQAAAQVLNHVLALAMRQQHPGLVVTLMRLQADLPSFQFAPTEPEEALAVSDFHQLCHCGRPDCCRLFGYLLKVCVKLPRRQVLVLVAGSQSVPTLPSCKSQAWAGEISANASPTKSGTMTKATNMRHRNNTDHPGPRLQYCCYTNNSARMHSQYVSSAQLSTSGGRPWVSFD